MYHLTLIRGAYEIAQRLAMGQYTEMRLGSTSSCMRSHHQPSPLQPHGSMGKEKWKDLISKKQDEVSSTHNRNNKHLASQTPLQNTQDFTGSNQAKKSQQQPGEMEIKSNL